MTTEDIKLGVQMEIVDSAICRAYGCLKNQVDPKEIAACLYSIDTGYKLLGELESAAVADAKVEYAKAELGLRRFQSESDGYDAEQKTEEPKQTLTKDEVKAKLLALSDQYDDLDVSVVMESMGYSKLSDIPADKYSLLLDKVAEVVKELA